MHPHDQERPAHHPDLTLREVGVVRSRLTDPAAAPKQGREGAPDAEVHIHPAFRAALEGVAAGDRLELLTWLHHADRDALRVHPRDDAGAPLRGVFATRSADRPSPIGLHTVTVRAVDGARLRVGPLEAVDGTPVLDLKPHLPPAVDGVRGR
ncbi:MAG: tRNA (N6-threonylcarbamoyladenosine(37)-N6)-methyltransferase TrmO [Thermoleophilia bacterium]